MALILSSKYQIDVDGDTLYVTDMTGQYDADDNVGGWGAPNSSLAESALIAIVQRFIGTTGTSLTPISNQVVYDSTANENKETQFTFNTGTDGHIKVTLLRLPVSLDGSNTVESNEIQSGDFFYWNSLVWKMVGTDPVEKTIDSLLLETSVVKNTCEDLMFPDLAIKYNSLYQAYKAKRDTDCNAAEALFQELLHLRVDLYGAKTSFRSGLVTVAENVIDNLLQKYDLA